MSTAQPGGLARASERVCAGSVAGEGPLFRHPTQEGAARRCRSKKPCQALWVAPAERVVSFVPVAAPLRHEVEIAALVGLGDVVVEQPGIAAPGPVGPGWLGQVPGAHGEFGLVDEKVDPPGRDVEPD
jgi:hypothetical protein